MKLCILLHTTDFRGDHSADVIVPIEPMPGETIWQLVTRVRLKGDGGFDRSGDHISIRLVAIEADAEKGA